MVFHEAGHVIDSAYRKRCKISEHYGDNRSRKQTEAVSVFFEAFCNNTNDSTHQVIRLIGLYRIKFKLEFVKKIKLLGDKERKENSALHSKIKSIVRLSVWQPWKQYDYHNNKNLTEDEKIKNDNATNYKNYIIKQYPQLKFLYDLWEKQAKE